MMSEKMLIKNNDVHLWFTFPDEICDAELLSDYLVVMTPEERAQQKRFYFSQHQKQYLISRALIRTTLSYYTGVAPHQWRFTYNKYGRPEIKWPKIDIPLRFNLSHTSGLIVLAVTHQRDIGVDLEDTLKREVDIEIIKSFFASDEVNVLLSLPPVVLVNRFYEIWTLKEAYVKARGMGLSIPLDQFAFYVDNDRTLQVSFDAKLNDYPQDWCFWLLQPTFQHKAALALRIEPWRTVNLLCRNSIPMKRVKPYACAIINSSRSMQEHYNSGTP